MGVMGVTEQLTSMVSRFSFAGTGTVQLVDAMNAYVTVGETLIQAGYVRQSEPVAGDTVVVVRQGASWLVLGTASVSGGNAVQNPSFELTDPGDLPTGWTLYNITNTSTSISVDFPDRAVDGNRLLEVRPTGIFTAQSFTYSQPISVVEGDQWEISAHVNGWYPNSAFSDSADPGLYALWFDSVTDLYPTTASADTAVDTATNIPDGEFPMVLRGTVTVPLSVTFLRVGLRSQVGQYTALHWDQVMARKVS